MCLDVVERMLSKIWDQPLKSDLLTKMIDVSRYSNLREGVPDDYIHIEEVYSKNGLRDIWDNFREHLAEHEVFPFLGTLGEAVVCIGYGNANKGEIYCFDWDFGCFNLSHEKLDEFLENLMTKDKMI